MQAALTLGDLSLYPQLFAVGGFDGLQRLCSVERYDPFSNTWAAVASLPEPVSSAAVAPCAGRLYVIGGAGQDGISTNKVGQERVVEAYCVPGAELGLSCPGPFSHLISLTALRSHPHVSGKEMNSEMTPQGHTVGLDHGVWGGT